MIHSAGLVVERVAPVERLPIPVLETLYLNSPLMTKTIWQRTIEYMTAGPCEVGIVTGKNALAALVEISGDSTNPHRCQIGTIRHTFGCQYPPILLDEGYYYYRNIIHRPKTYEELLNDFAVISQLLP